MGVRWGAEWCLQQQTPDVDSWRGRMALPPRSPPCPEPFACVHHPATKKGVALVEAENSGACDHFLSGWDYGLPAGCLQATAWMQRRVPGDEQLHTGMELERQSLATRTVKSASRLAERIPNARREVGPGVAIESPACQEPAGAAKTVASPAYAPARCLVRVLSALIPDSMREGLHWQYWKESCLEDCPREHLQVPYSKWRSGRKRFFDQQEHRSLKHSLQWRTPQ